MLHLLLESRYILNQDHHYYVADWDCYDDGPCNLPESISEAHDVIDPVPSNKFIYFYSNPSGNLGLEN